MGFSIKEITCQTQESTKTGTEWGVAAKEHRRREPRRKQDWETRDGILKNRVHTYMEITFGPNHTTKSNVLCVTATKMSRHTVAVHCIGLSFQEIGHIKHNYIE